MKGASAHLERVSIVLLHQEHRRPADFFQINRPERACRTSVFTVFSVWSSQSHSSPTHASSATYASSPMGFHVEACSCNDWEIDVLAFLESVIEGKKCRILRGELQQRGLVNPCQLRSFTSGASKPPRLFSWITHFTILHMRHMRHMRR